MRFQFLCSLALYAGVHAGGDADDSSTASVSAASTVQDRSLSASSYSSYSSYSPSYSGDRACNYYTDCYGCLSRSSCLWDPNTLGGTCKPKEQCDFTYQPRALVLSSSVAAAPPATACVRSASQCNQYNFNGAPLNPNPSRGVGCTNNGQCGSNQYCFSCTKCTGNCGACNTPGVRVSGSCGPAYRCPIDNDSISGTCPIVGSPYPPVVTYPTSCNYYSCGSCTAAYGCVWSGSSCYYSTTPCTGYGCANTPNQCFSSGGQYPGGNTCNYYGCSSCTAAYGCVWSGSSCYYATSPCTGYGCANTPDQCYSYSPYTYPTSNYNPVTTYPSTSYYAAPYYSGSYSSSYGF